MVIETRPPESGAEDTGPIQAAEVTEPGTQTEVAATPAVDLVGAERELASIRIGRLVLIVGLPVIAAAIMTGGLFIGVGGRVWAGLAGIGGIALAVWANRTKQQATMYLGVLLGIFAIGLIAVVPTGFGNVTGIASEIRKAVATSDVLRPPVEFLPGWHAIIGWVMGSLGFAAGWLAIELRRPALGLMATLPIIGVGAISLPQSQQLGSGLTALVLFGIALGLLSGTQEGDEEEQRAARQYEIRRAVRALPLIGLVTVALYFASRSSFLFPEPIYNPAQEAKLPKSTPLSEVEDRVLFTVSAKFTGPWKMGSLDVYDGKDWRLPPFAQSELKEVPSSGIVNEDLRPGVRADFTIRGLTGAVLPTLPNTVGIVAEGPKLAYDNRTGNVRVAQGTVETGFKYIVAAADIPAITALRRADPTIPRSHRPFLETKEGPPPAVEGLLAQAPKNRWDKLDYVRQTFLRTVTATGAGTPVSVPPSRVQDMLAGSKKGTPYEIVAGQALLARWAGIPSRIGYGFDGGEPGPGGVLEVRPKHGALFLEVFFNDFGWLPVIGNPVKAQASFSNSQQQQSQNVQTSQNVAVRIFLPILTEEKSRFFEHARVFVVRVLPIIGGLLLIYYLWPLPYKAIRRARRRTWAAERGPEARIALAYAEWRDHAADYGYRHYTDTPLMFLERVVPDEQHTEFAWLVTRVLWGDMRGRATDEDALAAEELSRSLRKRLSAVQPGTLRFVAALSRLSIRHPYAPGLDVAARQIGEGKREHATV